MILLRTRCFGLRSSFSALKHRSFSSDGPIRESLFYLHDTLTCPWSFTIVATTVIIRALVTLPLSLHQRQMSKRSLQIQPLLSAWKNTIDKTVSTQSISSKNQKMTLTDQQVKIRTMYRDHARILYSKFNCNPMKQIVLPLIQIPIFIYMTMEVRNLAGFDFLWFTADPAAAGMLTEGILWFTDLTVCDPTLIGPIILGTLQLVNTELNNLLRISTPSTISRVLTIVFRALSVLMIYVATQVPAAVLLYWITSAAFSIFQNGLFLLYETFRPSNNRIPVIKN
ncbi:60Kd inner membrane protein-domain-containing protein [Globomyces pollinis-pini]|nr:60Kd inner membrane protein-domain-containing protein [Globomyces pollinis-pini]